MFTTQSVSNFYIYAFYISMQVDQPHRINFKAIKLSASDTYKAKEIIHKLKSGVSDANFDIGKTQLFKVFDKYLQKEAHEAYFKYEKQDYLQELYFAFFSCINDILKENKPLEALINVFEKIKTSPEVKVLRMKNGISSLDRPLYRDSNKYTVVDSLTVENLPRYLSTPSEEEYEVIRTNFKSIVNDAQLSQKEENIIMLRSKGLKCKAIGMKNNITESSANKTLRAAKAKIQDANNVLPESFKKKYNEFCKMSELSGFEKHIKDMLLSWPDIVTLDMSYIRSVIDKSSKILGVSTSQYSKLALARPTLFYQKPETTKSKIDAAVSLLGVSRKDFIKAGLKQPQLFYQNPETLKSNVEKTAELLKIKKNDWVKAAIKQPHLIYIKPDTIYQNMVNTSKKLGIEPEKFVKMALAQPTILALKPESVYNNLKIFSIVLQTDMENCKKIAAMMPTLLYLKPQSIIKNVNKLADLLDVDRDKLLKFLISKPSVLASKPESIRHRVLAGAYYKKIKGKEVKNIFKLIVAINPLHLHASSLAYLVYKADNAKVRLDSIAKRETQLAEYLKSKPESERHYVLTIPDDEMSEEFINYAKEFSIKLFNKNIFEFKIDKSI